MGLAKAQRLRTTLRALHNRNYRLFYIGQGISLVGTWMQMVATGWLVNRLTGSAVMLGVVAFANRIPSLFITPLAGVYLDRCNKHKVVLACQALAMVQALGLGTLALTGHIAAWHVALFSLGLGLVSAVEVPARQSFFVQLVDNRDDLANAIALNSTLFNGARLLGPAVAGALIAITDEGVCFLINGVSYLAVIIGLLRMDVTPVTRPPRRSVLEDLREGVQFVFGCPPIRALVSLVALVSLLGMPYHVLMPMYATECLKVGSKGLGFLMAAGGGGAMLGALYLAQRTSVRGLERLLPRATCVFGGGLILLALSRELWLSLLLMPLIGAGMMVQQASANTLLQSLVDDSMRGRVVSFHVLASMGVSPIGSLLAGFAANRVGVPWTYAGGGVAALLAATVFILRLPALWRLAQPMYEAQGLGGEAGIGLDSPSPGGAKG